MFACVFTMCLIFFKMTFYHITGGVSRVIG